jgi:uncharacterized protein with PIN domain
MKNFLCDDTIGKLMKKLRLLGFDAKPWSDKCEPDRIFLTRSRKRWENYDGESFLIFADDWKSQLKELEVRYSISKEIKPFTRCVECNTELIDVNLEEVRTIIPERVFLSTDRFKKCPNCGRTYWMGTHVEKIKDDFKEVFDADEF